METQPSAQSHFHKLNIAIKVKSYTNLGTRANWICLLCSKYCALDCIFETLLNRVNFKMVSNIEAQRVF